MEIARDALYNAANMNMNREIILKKSQKIDEYIVKYYLENRNVDEGKNTRTCSC
ncbi:aspartyl-phosphate phosphatase Spo0E family protein [Syntrophaceticus schinkii]